MNLNYILTTTHIYVPNYFGCIYGAKTESNEPYSYWKRQLFLIVEGNVTDFL